MGNLMKKLCLIYGLYHVNITFNITLIIRTAYSVSMVRKRKETYYERWRKEHPELRIYLTKEEYNFIKSLAEKEGTSMKEVVLGAFKGLYKESFIQGIKLATEFANLYAKALRETFQMSKSTGEIYSVDTKELVEKLIGEVNENSSLFKAFEELRDALYDCVMEGEQEMEDIFIDDQHAFYDLIMDHANKVRKLGVFEPALFTVPCNICYEPMIFTHTDKNWETEVKPTLLEAFNTWSHTKCRETQNKRITIQYPPK